MSTLPGNPYKTRIKRAPSVCTAACSVRVVSTLPGNPYKTRIKRAPSVCTAACSVRVVWELMCSCLPIHHIFLDPHILWQGLPVLGIFCPHFWLKPVKFIFLKPYGKGIRAKGLSHFSGPLFHDGTRAKRWENKWKRVRARNTYKTAGFYSKSESRVHTSWEPL